MDGVNYCFLCQRTRADFQFGVVNFADLSANKDAEAHSLYPYAYDLCFRKAPISRPRAGSTIEVENESHNCI
jgi:hypothetical protein